MTQFKMWDHSVLSKRQKAAFSVGVARGGGMGRWVWRELREGRESLSRQSQLGIGRETLRTFEKKRYKGFGAERAIGLHVRGSVRQGWKVGGYGPNAGVCKNV